MQIATRAATAITFGKPARSRRQARPAPAAADLPAPDSQPLPARLLAGTPAAMPTGTCLMPVPASIPDAKRWRGGSLMIPPIAAATVANRARYRVFALRVIPPDEHGREVAVRTGDLLRPSRRYDEHGDPAEGLARGAAAFGFKDRQGLARAIEAVGWQVGRQVCLVGGSGALRSDEYGTHIIMMPTAIMVWYRQYPGLGRVSAYLESADYE